MAELHDGEPDVSEGIVRALLARELPTLADRPLTDVTGAGTDNALWRLDLDESEQLVLRLPRRRQSDAAIEHEAAVLGALGRSLLSELVELPEVVHVGAPQPEFAHRWLALRWIPGDDLWDRAPTGPEQIDLAERMGAVVAAIGALEVEAPRRGPGRRGGPMEPLVETIHRWLDDPQWSAADFVDVERCKILANEALDCAPASNPGFVHGDLLPGNVVRTPTGLAVIDWGGAALADLAQDLAPAWSIFDPEARAVFREASGADDAAWLRARTFELEHAIGGMTYYEPKSHPLGDVMRRTYERIMAEAFSS